LEFAENRGLLEQDGRIVPAGDVLVLAGDVSYLGDLKMIRMPFFDWCAENYWQTYIVPGNHEFYHGYDIAQTMADYEYKYRENVRYLNNASVVLENTELFFSTLWTKINPLFLWSIQRGMNDFRHGILEGERLSANDVDGLHRRCVEWLEAALKASTAKTKIVVTHHCPTLRDVFNGYPGGALNSAFQVDMDSFIERTGADYWLYGHTHYSGGSGTVIGKTRLLCNQMGYVFYGDNKDFLPDAVIEV
jgi:3',5'-cyclic AMP phosphodiesterase CpdA